MSKPNLGLPEVNYDFQAHVHTDKDIKIYRCSHTKIKTEGMDSFLQREAKGPLRQENSGVLHDTAEHGEAENAAKRANDDPNRVGVGLSELLAN